MKKIWQKLGAEVLEYKYHVSHDDIVGMVRSN